MARWETCDFNGFKLYQGPILLKVSVNFGFSWPLVQQRPPQFLGRKIFPLQRDVSNTLMLSDTSWSKVDDMFSFAHNSARCCFFHFIRAWKSPKTCVTSNSVKIHIFDHKHGSLAILESLSFVSWSTQTFFFAIENISELQRSKNNLPYIVSRCFHQKILAICGSMVVFRRCFVPTFHRTTFFPRRSLPQTLVSLAWPRLKVPVLSFSGTFLSLSVQIGNPNRFDSAARGWVELSGLKRASPKPSRLKYFSLSAPNISEPKAWLHSCDAVVHCAIAWITPTSGRLCFVVATLIDGSVRSFNLYSYQRFFSSSN